MNKSIQSDKNNITTNSQQPTDQQDATNPQETGRSMTEMLGVLAVIGVLSIGGIQGYTYAMNKYRANEVVNELNLLNAQLAMFMNGIHETEAVMSLGEPYDNGEKINAGGYAFAYGCGQDPESTSPCDLDETGYYMTLTGVPEEVCKSATQMTANMMNLVEQKVNGTTDNGGILCQDEGNEIILLFDANDGQGFENGDGGDGNGGVEGEDSDENDNNEPEVTYPPEEEEESTTTTPETTTTTTRTETETDTATETATATYSGNSCTSYECSSNSDCDSGYYCDIQCYNDYCTKDTSDMGGSCRKASSDLRDKPASAPYWMSSRTMYWWSAKNFCEALGKTLVEVSDYGCAHSICPSGCSATWGYCHATASQSVTSIATNDRAAKVQAMNDAYGSTYGWTNTDYSSCYAYNVTFSNGYVNSGPNRDHDVYAVCK